MQLTMTREELRQAAAGFTKIAGGRASSPVCGGVRFEAGKRRAIAEVTDLDQCARYTFAEARVRGDGVFVVPLSLLKEMGKGGRSEEVRFETGATPEIVHVENMVGGHAIRFEVNSTDPVNWPGPATPVPTRPSEGFLPAYRRLLPFVSGEPGRSIRGVYIDPEGKGARPVSMVGCDGRRLTVFNSMSLPVSGPLIVPVTAFLSWAQLPGETGLGTVRRDDTTLFALEAGPWHYSVRVLDDTYPAYRSVIPPDGPEDRVYAFSDADAELMRKVVPGLPGKDIIFLEGGADGRITLHSRAEGQTEWTTVPLATSRHEGEQGCIAVNPRYLIDAMNAGFRRFSSSISATDGSEPLLSKDGNGGIHVLMPWRCDKETYQPGTARGTAAEQDEGPEQKKDTEPEQDTVQEQDMVNEKKAGNKTVPEPRSRADDKKTDRHRTAGPRRTAQRGTVAEADPRLDKSREDGDTQSPLERALAAGETARGRISDAQSALTELSRALKAAIREGRGRENDLVKARAAMQKLQAISL